MNKELRNRIIDEYRCWEEDAGEKPELVKVNDDCFDENDTIDKANKGQELGLYYSPENEIFVWLI